MAAPLAHTGYGTQIRKSPFFESTLRYGFRGFSVYNHMYIPRDFGDPVRNYWNLIERVILCDVSVERQVEISGPDAFRFVRTLTPRNLEKWKVGRCRYALVVDQEGGMLSYHADMTIENNPYELNLERLVDLEQDQEFVGKEALRRIKQDGVSQHMVGLHIDAPAFTGPNETKWNVVDGDEKVGYVTSGVYSPRLHQNIALAMMRVSHVSLGTKVRVQADDGIHAAVVVRYPFFDPDKRIAKST